MLQRLLSLLKASYVDFSAQRCASRGAAIAFYTATSIAPVLLIAIAIAGLAFGQKAASGAIFAQFRGLLGSEGADLLQKAVLNASDKSASVVASVISVVTLVVTASGVFVELEDALNAIWKAEPRGGLLNLARARIVSLGLVVALGFLLMVSLVIDAALTGLSGLINEYLPFGSALLLGISFVLSLMLLTLLFSAMFKFVPAKRLSWREVMPGAAVTAFLFQIGKFLIGLYLGSSSAASSLGAAGALLGLLFWIYYSGQIFLFGAAFTKSYAQPTTRWQKATPPKERARVSRGQGGRSGLRGA